MSTDLLVSQRIQLRAVALPDAEQLQTIVDDQDIYNNTLTIPSVVPPGWATTWIEKLTQGDNPGSFVIVEKSTDKIVGMVSLVDISPVHEHAELAYMIGRDFRRKGFAFEAIKLMINYGFEQLGLSRIYAYHLGHNQASGDLLMKLGFEHEGCMRSHIKKDGVFVDSEVYGLLKDTIIYDALPAQSMAPKQH